MHYLDEGWTIILCSDHALSCSEHDGSKIMGNTNGVNADPLRKLGYTVLKRDEDGNIIGKSRAIDEVDIDVKEGQFIAILGHNGSGKSTFPNPFQ